MKKYPKLVLGILLVTGIVILSLFLVKPKTTSKAYLNSEKNKFSLAFDIKNQDKDEAQKLLEKLNLPANTTDGIQFELDSATSTKLAFTSPLTINLSFLNNRLSFSTENQQFKGKHFIPPKNVKIPQNTNIAIFAENFNGIVSKNFKLQQNLEDWLNANFKSESGQFFIAFGENRNFVIAQKSQTSIDFSTLAGIVSETEQQELYKTESDNEVNYHLLKLPGDNKEATLVLFEAEDLTFLTSSLDTAKEITKMYKEGESSKGFLEGEFEPISTAILISNSKDSNSDSIELVTSSASKIKPFISKIKEARIIISQNRLSGSLETL
ncbi:MAG: hypothetical protein NUV69_02875 [Candidatus Curtissbacteria bacterium]|nr:hypothetical protein [Candidatus Curtissbacteria bacterium]